MEKVSDALSRRYPQFNTISQFAWVSDALYKMSCENVEFLIAMEDDRFQGVITEHDIAAKVLFDDRPLNKIRVKEFMTRTLPVATSDNSLEYCLELMEKYGAKHIVIFDDFDFKGVISAHDLAQRMLAQNKTLSSVEDEMPAYPLYY